MNQAQCPSCNTTLSFEEMAEGWCETCGKRIPKYIYTFAGVSRDDVFTGRLAHVVAIEDPRSDKCTCGSRLCGRSTEASRTSRKDTDMPTTWVFCPRCNKIECFVEGCDKESVTSISHMVTIKQGRSKYASSKYYSSDNCFCGSHARIMLIFTGIDSWNIVPCGIGFFIAITFGGIHLANDILGTQIPISRTFGAVGMYLFLGGMLVWWLIKTLLQLCLILLGITKKEEYSDEFWDPVKRKYYKDTDFLD